jgi:hypothetical protein
MKISINQLRQIIREEVVRSLRLIEVNMMKMKSDDFNAAAKKAYVNVTVYSDVEIESGDGGVSFYQDGKLMKLSPEDARDIYIAHTGRTRLPVGRGERGGGG